MKEKHTRSANIQSKETSHISNQIGNIFVTKEYKNGNVCLILENRDEKAESITISYEESHKLGIKTLGNFELLSDSQRKVLLPKGFEKWKKLDFEVKGENKSVFNTSLKKFKAEAIVQETWERIAELARTYKDGEAIDFVDIENPTPSQKVLWMLNWVAGTIRKWKNELEQCGGTDRNLINTLTYGEQAIKERLKAIRGDSTPVPNQPELETDINTDTGLNEIQNKCNLDVARFEGRLFGYEERCEIDDLEQYNQFIPQFIKDRLFNGVARFLSFEQLPEHLDHCLQLVGYEVVPIEIGKTKADARLHDIQASRQTGVAPGTIVKVISPGLRRKVDGEIIQKPVVIRGE